MSLSEKVSEAKAILDDAFWLHAPTHVFALFSGGHDSLCATHLASQHMAFSGAVHINTTIGIEETHEFVRDTCRRHTWPLIEYWPPVAYEDIVLAHGLPGPGSHRFMYIRLKERCLDQLIRDHKKGRFDRTILVTGVRLQESDRRMGHVEAVVRKKTRVWTAPLLNWSSEDKLEYMALHGLKANPVVEQLCMSGECLCGAFAHPGELHEISALYPAAAERIRVLESVAEIVGKPAKWGERPSRNKTAFALKSDSDLCWSCGVKASTQVV